MADVDMYAHVQLQQAYQVYQWENDPRTLALQQCNKTIFDRCVVLEREYSQLYQHAQAQSTRLTQQEKQEKQAKHQNDEQSKTIISALQDEILVLKQKYNDANKLASESKYVLGQQQTESVSLDVQVKDLKIQIEDLKRERDSAVKALASTPVCLSLKPMLPPLPKTPPTTTPSSPSPPKMIKKT